MTSFFSSFLTLHTYYNTKRMVCELYKLHKIMGKNIFKFVQNFLLTFLCSYGIIFAAGEGYYTIIYVYLSIGFLSKIKEVCYKTDLFI